MRWSRCVAFAVEKFHAAAFFCIKRSLHAGSALVRLLEEVSMASASAMSASVLSYWT